MAVIAETNEPVVVFLVGGHSHNRLAVHHWFKLAQAFLHLLRYLSRHPHAGYLGGHTQYRMFPFGLVLESYWRSADDLESFAREPHLQAWTSFVKQTATTSALSIWHETYCIQPGQCAAPAGVLPPLIGSEPLIPF